MNTKANPIWRSLKRKVVQRGYKPISDYGLIGDQNTCALVGIDGSIDWLCIPTFQSSSVFAAILDARKGGCFSIMPDCENFESLQYYRGDTNVLVTEFRSKDGHAKITDFMPCFKVEKTMVTSGEIHRKIELLDGTLNLRVTMAPRFNYGSSIPKVKRVGNFGYTFFEEVKRPARQEMALLTDLEFQTKRGTITQKITEPANLVVKFGGLREHHKADTFTDLKLRETLHYWQNWASRCKYSGNWKAQVVRSALTLKLLIYEQTGAIVAAPTTSLPEGIGGVRNWDYRYSWIRDSSFVLWAFHSIGYKEEALQYLEWIIGMYYLSGGDLQVLIGILGERDVTESTVNNLEGYRKSSPVRIGNAAWDQFQLDVYGILLDAMYFGHRHGGHSYEKIYNHMIKQIMEALERDWRKPDRGIWEVRGEMQHFVYSKVWCWVAADRAMKIAHALGVDEDEKRWGKLAIEIRDEIIRKGWDNKLNSFVRAYGTKDLDAANLLIPQVRFTESSDPMMRGTIEATKKHLMRDKYYLYRYVVNDGLPGGEGAFLICSFWLVKCLAESGKVNEAKEMMDNLVAGANHLGLFSEEYDPKKKMHLGNFPQAFTHMGFITAASALDRALSGAVHQSSEKNMSET